MNHYVMHDIETESGEAVEPRVLAKCYGRVEAEMLNALLKDDSPLERNATWGPRFFIVRESELDHEAPNRRAVAAFEVDGPDPKDAAEIEILRASLWRYEDERDLRRYMVQRLLLEDEGHDHMWKDKLLPWIMRGPRTPDHIGRDVAEGMDEFERLLAEGKAQEEELFGQMREERRRDGLLGLAARGCGSPLERFDEQEHLRVEHQQAGWLSGSAGASLFLIHVLLTRTDLRTQAPAAFLPPRASSAGRW